MPYPRVCAVVLALVLTGCSAPAAGPPPADTPESTTTTATATTADVQPVSRVEPTEVRIPRIDAKSSLVPLGLNPDETIQVPPVEQPMQAGWYVHARAPGEPGPAIILGHVDGNSQPGVFYRLREVVPGDEVEVSRTDGSVVEFAVEKVDQVPKDRFPTDAVYGDTPDSVLRLITCGGVFDRSARSYEDNVIVYAKMIKRDHP
ncbi:class F sortase [Saccharothrix deserti]|uniref:class F sortase n=1 Tax=Saccharothrix deserti TaxID=2593674 RepID=UPI00131BB386|nr:class F sortase [Saccharothrix deserti]